MYGETLRKQPTRTWWWAMNTSVLDGVSSVSDEAVLLALAGEQRRAIVRLLEDSPDDQLPIEGVIDEVTTHIGGGDNDADRRRHRTRIGLYHLHLPKLDDAGIADWDRDLGVVRAGARFDAATAILSTWADTVEGGPAD